MNKKLKRLLGLEHYNLDKVLAKKPHEWDAEEFDFLVNILCSNYQELESEGGAVEKNKEQRLKVWKKVKLATDRLDDGATALIFVYGDEDIALELRKIIRASAELQINSPKGPLS